MKNFLNNIKDGLTDAKNMLQEHKFKPFILPVIILLVVWFGLKNFNHNASSRVTAIKNKIEAQKAEINNEVEYKASKATYDSLVKRLPPEEKKNEWLLGQMIGFFEARNIYSPKAGKHNLEESGIFTMSSVTYDFETDFATLGKLLESIENSEHFIRISDLSVTRLQSSLGRVSVSLRVNTIFVNEKAANTAIVRGGV